MKAVIAVVFGTALFSAALAVSQADAASRKKKVRLSGVIPPAAAVVHPRFSRGAGNRGARARASSADILSEGIGQ